jgi:rhamnosyltransferase
MLDCLFIDLVDIEWGLRAKGRGYQSFGVCAAKMKHTLGGTPISFFGKDFASHSPLRHYYQFRNTIWLCRQSWLSFNWKFVSGKSLILKFTLYSMFEKPRFAHFEMMLKGIWHGLVGEMGKFKEDARV